MSQTPLILVTNDDGVTAPGLRSLVDCLQGLGQIVVVAPDQPQSGKSSAITVGDPLHVTEHPDYNGARVLSVSGTPVDCVKLALHTILPRRPNVVFAGINHGSNSGTAITYSGTMGAVLEGCMAGVPSVGFSLMHHSLKADFSLSAAFVTDIAANVVSKGLPHWVCLNVNIPARVEPVGVRVCRAAKGHWSEEYTRYLDPQGNPFYWLTGRFVNTEPEATDTDEYWLGKNYISVVPASPDQTAEECIAPMGGEFNRG